MLGTRPVVKRKLLKREDKSKKKKNVRGQQRSSGDRHLGARSWTGQSHRRAAAAGVAGVVVAAGGTAVAVGAADGRQRVVRRR